ncbi:hypothetical protein ABK046_51740, partial [Streptomyces caeruleatus]
MSRPEYIGGHQVSDQLTAGTMKAGSAWIVVAFSKLGITNWSDLAAVLASIYTTLLIIDWLWKKFSVWRTTLPPGD